MTTTAPTSIALSGAAIATNSNCQFSVTITGTVSGSYTNTTAPVSSANGGTGNTANANLTVDSPPMVTNAFGAGTIPVNGTTSLAVPINNPNMSSMTGVAFTNTACGPGDCGNASRRQHLWRHGHSGCGLGNVQPVRWGNRFHGVLRSIGEREGALR